jgi:hypothetical protein
MSFIHDHDHTHDHRCEIDNHGDREVAVVLASMSVSPPTGGVFGPSITGPIDHEGEPEVDMDDVEDGDDETEDSAEPTPLGAQYPGDFQAARKTTRGRKLAAVTRESIADLTADEQKMVLGYTRKYQQKAAAIVSLTLSHH